MKFRIIYPHRGLGKYKQQIRVTQILWARCGFGNYRIRVMFATHDLCPFGLLWDGKRAHLVFDYMRTFLSAVTVQFVPETKTEADLMTRAIIRGEMSKDTYEAVVTSFEEYSAVRWEVKYKGGKETKRK